MDPALVLTLTLPGVALLLLAVAVAEQVAARLGRRGPVSRRRRHALSAAGLDVFSVALAPTREADIEEHHVREMTREDPDDGAPPRTRIDLDSGVVVLDRPSRPDQTAGGSPRRRTTAAR